MSPSRAETLAWEARWSRPAGIAALVAAAFFVAAIVAGIQVGGGDGNSEILRNVDADRGVQLASNILRAIGVALLALPLYFLFRAAQARSERMRGELVGLVLFGPLLLAVVVVLSGIATLSAASEFVSDEVPRLMAQGVELDSDRANDVADDVIADVPLRGFAGWFGLAGQLAFIVGMFYSALHAMRTGLLTRFWGALGLALAVVSPFVPQFMMFWFVYLGLLLVGVLPGPKPPAWETGEAMPWPTPGEKAAEEMGDDEREDEPERRE